MQQATIPIIPDREKKKATRTRSYSNESIKLKKSNKNIINQLNLFGEKLRIKEKE